MYFLSLPQGAEAHNHSREPYMFDTLFSLVFSFPHEVFFLISKM